MQIGRTAKLDFDSLKWLVCVSHLFLELFELNTRYNRKDVEITE